MVGPSARQLTRSFLGVTTACALALAAAPSATAGQPSASLVIRWTKVPGAKGYVIQIAADRKMRKVVTKAKTKKNVYRWKRLGRRRYYYRVAAIDKKGNVGHYSGVNLIRQVVSSPKPLGPPAGAKIGLGNDGAPVKLKWRGAEGIREYILTITRKGAPAVVKRLKSTSLAWTAPALGRYTWRVSGVDYNGDAVKAGPERTFVVVVGPPKLTSPGPGTRVVWKPERTTVKLNWSKRPVAAYIIQVAEDPGFKSILGRRQLGRASLAYHVKKLGNHYWRVRGVKPDTAWSSPRTMRVILAPPKLRSPARGDQLGIDDETRRVKLEWEPSHDATAYEVRFRKKRSKKKPKPVLVEGTSFETKPLGLGRYVWSVRALRAGLHASNYTKGSFEIVDKPRAPAPVVAGPSDGSHHELDQGDKLELSWQPVDGATGYEVELAPTSDFAAGLTKHPSTLTSVRLSPPRSGPYHWRVRAVDAEGRSGRWSEPSSLTVKLYEPYRWDPAVASRLELGVGGGLVYNLGEILTGRPTLDLTVWLPAIEYRLGLVLRAGWFTAGSTIADAAQGVSVDARLHAVPIDLMLVFRFPHELGAITLGVGPHVSVIYGSLSAPGRLDTFDTEAVFGGTGLFGAQFDVGPGALFVDVGYTVLMQSDGLISGTAGGLIAALGYRVVLL